MDDAERRKPYRPWSPSVWFRDGLMLAFLSSRPATRLKSISALEIGKQFVQRNGTWWLILEPEETKNSEHIEQPFPEKLVPWLERYLASHRPRLLGDTNSDRLWITADGLPMTYNGVARRVPEISLRVLDRRLTCQLFRHAAVTTITETDPKNAGMAGFVIGDRSHQTVERYYNKGRMVIAVDRLQKTIRGLRREADERRRQLRRDQLD